MLQLFHKLPLGTRIKIPLAALALVLFVVDAVVNRSLGDLGWAIMCILWTF
jgi:hypothetical protein